MKRSQIAKKIINLRYYKKYDIHYFKFNKRLIISFIINTHFIEIIKNSYYNMRYFNKYGEYNGKKKNLSKYQIKYMAY